jgi:hypothetical protein
VRHPPAKVEKTSERQPFIERFFQFRVRKPAPLLQQQRLEHHKRIEPRPPRTLRLEPRQKLLEPIPFHLTEKPLQYVVPSNLWSYQCFRKAQRILHEVEDSLRRLRTDHIDIYQVVAVVGAPLDDPHHASNAVRAALRCAASLGTLDRVRTAFGPVRQRIGLNSGEALVVKRLPNLTRYLECTPWGGQVGDLRIG